MTKVPSWIITWGANIIFLILSLIIIVSSLIHYPTTINTDLKIEFNDKTVFIVSTEGGTIPKLSIKQGQNIILSLLLAVITVANPDSNRLALIAPKTGKTGYINLIHQGFFCGVNEELFRIEPNERKPRSLMLVPKDQINQIKNVQLVQVTLNNKYYAEKYGVFKEKISFIIGEPSHGSFAAKVIFTDLDSPKNATIFKTG